MCGGVDWGVEIREERSCKSEDRVENYPQSFKNEWKIHGCRVLVYTQIPQFWDTEHSTPPVTDRITVLVLRNFIYSTRPSSVVAIPCGIRVSPLRGGGGTVVTKDRDCGTLWQLGTE